MYRFFCDILFDQGDRYYRHTILGYLQILGFANKYVSIFLSWRKNDFLIY